MRRWRMGIEISREKVNYHRQGLGKSLHVEFKVRRDGWNSLEFEWLWSSGLGIWRL